MLRFKLFFGLLILVSLLWAVGAASIMLMRQSASINIAAVNSEYRTIDASLKVISITTSLNVHYLPSITAESIIPRPNRELYDQLNPQFDEVLAVLRGRTPEDERWNELMSQFATAIGNFRVNYETYFGESHTSPDERKQLMESIRMQTQRLTELSGNMITHVDRELLVPASSEAHGKNTLFVVILVLLGTMIAFLQIRRGESLTRADHVMRSILKAIPSPVFIMENGSRIVQINPAAERLAEKLGIIGRLPEKIQHILDKCIETDSNFMPEDPKDALLYRVNEVEYYYLPRIFPFKSEGTAQSGWAVLLHNVSRIRWLDDMKTNLLSTVSHEIKTPLTGIRMVLHLLLEEDRGQNLSEVQRRMISSANDDSERLLLTLNSLLELSRFESGATHLMCVPTQLNDCIERAVRRHAKAASKQNITLEIEQGRNVLPDVFADAVRLDEVLNNLLENAIKHSPEGGVVKLRLSKPDADHVRVSIIDHGLGVPESSKSLVFERFYRAPDQKQDGVGLGLFISREIIRAHEGRIGINERTDNLTEFYFDVPIA